MGVGPFSSSSDTSQRDDHSNRPVAATDGALAFSIQGKGASAQTGGVSLAGKGNSLTIINEAPTATSLLENYVKSQANTGLSSAVPVAGLGGGDPESGGSGFDKATLAVVGLVVGALALVLFKR